MAGDLRWILSQDSTMGIMVDPEDKEGCRMPTIRYLLLSAIGKSVIGFASGMEKEKEAI